MAPSNCVSACSRSCNSSTSNCLSWGIILFRSLGWRLPLHASLAGLSERGTDCGQNVRVPTGEARIGSRDTKKRRPPYHIHDQCGCGTGEQLLTEGVPPEHTSG